MSVDPDHLLHAQQRRAPAAPRLPGALVAGATGALGNEVLRRLASGVRYAQVQVLASEPMTTLLQTVQPLHVAGDDIDTWPTAQGAAVGVVMFDRPRLLQERERALWTPGPEHLLSLARWMRRSGVSTLAVVLPHDQGRLPTALRAGLASLDEHAVATLGFERVLFLRAARKPGGLPPDASAPQRLAHWMLSNAHFMLPTAEQPVRATKVAEMLDVALQLAPSGIHVASPELVWQATQHDMQGTVARWLGRMPQAPARD